MVATLHLDSLTADRFIPVVVRIVVVLLLVTILLLVGGIPGS